MMNKLILAVMLLSSTVCADDTLNWSWTAPVERSDGTSFDMATEGRGYGVYFNDVLEMDPDSPTEMLLLSPGDNSLVKTFPPGDICAELITVDTGNRESGKSERSCKVSLAPPGPPSNLTVTIIHP